MKYNEKSAVHLSPEYLMGGYTAVDNIFICEYLRSAEELDVKVYLYGLYLAHSGADSSIETIKDYLNASEDDVIAAFSRLQDIGLVDVVRTFPLSVVYQPISASPIKPRKIKPGKYDGFNKELQSILGGRMITPNEFMDCYNLLELCHIQPEAYLLIASYCVNVKGKDVNPKYILSTARNFAYKNLTTLKSVENELNDYQLQTGAVSEVIKKLGLKRKVEIEDNNYYKKWIALGFDKNGVLAAAVAVKGTGASIKKLDSFLNELYTYKRFSAKEIEDFAASKAKMRDLTIEINKSLGIYMESLDAEINTYVIKWLSLGCSDRLLVRIAEMCFKTEKRKLQDMDDAVNRLTKLGVRNENEFFDYLNRVSAKDGIIKRLLATLSIERGVNGYDRKYYKKFEDLGFTEDVIFYAAEISKNADSPYPYMYSVLSNWKNANVVTKADAEKLAVKTSPTPKAKKQEEIITHNYTKEQWNAVYTSIEDLDIN